MILLYNYSYFCLIYKNNLNNNFNTNFCYTRSLSLFQYNLITLDKNNCETIL